MQNMTNNTNRAVSLEKITALAKRRGFIFQTSEIYGGLANAYDYGPLGTDLLLKVKELWWDFFIRRRDDMVGLDSQILLHPQTWVASGHVDSFTDPLVEDLVNHKRYRADALLEEYFNKNPEEQQNIIIADLSAKELDALLEKFQIKSPDGNPLSKTQDFNILFETAIGAVNDKKNKVYLRGETAQGIFSNFKQILNSTRQKLPFGVGQIGKSFRNEITSGQFIFRTLEFEQAEIEYFFDPKTTDWQELFKDWQNQMWDFVTKVLGVKEENLRWRRHTDHERSHYSQDTYDLEYRDPFGWKELWGIAYRTDYDLKQQQKFSKQSLEYIDPQSNEKFLPHVIEPAAGINRMVLMLLCDAYLEDPNKDRLVLGLKPQLASYQLAVFPLLKNKTELVSKARTVYEQLRQNYQVAWDERGNIGKRYLAQDEIGTPFCVTIDFTTLENDTVTIRHRDSATQERININQLDNYLQSVLA
jgi:glycyl-tRNA synthetase